MGFDLPSESKNLPKENFKFEIGNLRLEGNAKANRKAPAGGQRYEIRRRNGARLGETAVRKASPLKR